MEVKTKVEEMVVERQDAWINNTDDQPSGLKQILRPMLCALALSGNYNFKDIKTSQETSQSSLKSQLSVMYRLFLISMIIILIAKCIVAFFYLPREIQQVNALVLTWTLFLMCLILINFKATSLKYGHYENVFKFWDSTIMLEFQELGLKYPSQKMRARVVTVLVIVIAVTVVNNIGVGVQIVYNGGLLYTSPFKTNPVTLVIYFVLQTAATLVWLTPPSFLIVMTMIIEEAFKTLNNFALKLCQQNGHKMPENFNKLRLLHLNLCKLVAELDKDFSWFYAVDFIFCIGLGLFTLYQVINRNMTIFETMIFLYWFACGIILVAIPAVYAALVNDAAHAPLETIYHINVQDITVEKLAQLNLFLSKLTGTQVGFSTCGLLIITKEFILTIAGVFLTYFAVLYTL